MLHLSLFSENHNDPPILLQPESTFDIGTDSEDDLIKTYTTFFISFQPTYNIYPPLLPFDSLKKSILVLIDDNDPDIKIIKTITHHNKYNQWLIALSSSYDKSSSSTTGT